MDITLFVLDEEGGGVGWRVSAHETRYRALRRAAAERGWPVLEFSRPVSMRSRFPVPTAPVVTGAAMGVGAAVVGLAWYARHRALRSGLLAVDDPGPLSGRRRRRGA